MLMPKKQLDFYRSRLVEAWYDNEGASEGAPLVRRLGPKDSEKFCKMGMGEGLIRKRSKSEVPPPGVLSLKLTRYSAMALQNRHEYDWTPG